MLQFFSKFALYSKILFIMLLLTFSVATFSIVVFIQNDLPQYKTLVNLFYDIIESSSAISSAMNENNSDSVIENLNRLKIDPNIVSAKIYTFDGKKFTSAYTTPGETQTTEPVETSQSLISFLDKKLEIMYPVIKKDQTIGAIQIKTLISTNYIYSFIEMIFLITLISVFIAMYLSGVITKPILSLVTAMNTVTTQNDYSIRLKVEGDQETSTLIKTFNRMLETIQHQESLERSAQKQIKRLAYYDALTGLPNLELFKELVRQVIEIAKRNQNSLAILYLDIDKFKIINDTMGRDKGDLLLKKIAQTLQNYSQHTDLQPIISNIARVNGDEFVICMENVQGPYEVENIAKTLITIMNKSFDVDGDQINVSVSIGVAIYPENGSNIETLLKNAETAMYVCKEETKGQCKIFDNNIGNVIATRNKLEHDLSKALEQNELKAFYQPKYDLSSKLINGVELLLRWFHPALGMIPPNDFIPIAESSGLIIDIGVWVLKEGCKQCKFWHDYGFTNLHVSINLSPRQFADPDLISNVKQAISESGLDPIFLELELTESTIMMSDDKTLNILRELKNLGLKLSIDDFGTGYSSLRYLTRYPIDVIKIDKAFISHLIENANDATITRTIINLAHSLNLFVIAEGVETKEQLEYLYNYHCDAIQGYLISKPISASDMTNFLNKHGRGIYET